MPEHPIEHGSGGEHPGDDHSTDLVEWVVTVEEAHRADLETVAVGLESAGLRVDRVLSAVGMVSGTAPADRREALLQAPGVSDAQIQRRFTISPPDSDVQ